MNVLLLDNYDSFTFNLYQMMGEILEDSHSPFEIQVIRNNQTSLEELRSKNFDKIVISPGPGHPQDPAYFGVSKDILVHLSEKTPTLGICLGMQGMATTFGGLVERAKLPMHGKVSSIEHDGKGIFIGIPQSISVMRYHSLVVNLDQLPACLEVTARVSGPKEEPEIMGLRHKSYPLEGVQFHPESFASEEGKKMLSNFLFS